MASPAILAKSSSSFRCILTLFLSSPAVKPLRTTSHCLHFLSPAPGYPLSRRAFNDNASGRRTLYRTKNNSQALPEDSHYPNHVKLINCAIVQGSPCQALELLPKLPIMHRMKPPILVELAKSLAKCPLVTVDQRPQWSESVITVLDWTLESIELNTMWDIPALYIAHLARAISRRQLRSHVHHITKLIQFNERRARTESQRRRQFLNFSIIDMYARVNQPIDAIHYFSMIPKNQWSLYIVNAVCEAYALQRNHAAIRNLMQELFNTNILAHPFMSNYLNKVYIKSFAKLEDAVSALELISLELLSVDNQISHDKDLNPIPSLVIADLLRRCVTAVNPSLAQRILAVSDAHAIGRDAAITGWLIALRVHAHDFNGGLELYNKFMKSGHDITVPMMLPVIELLSELNLKDQLVQTHNYLLDLHCRKKLMLTTMYSKVAVRAFARAFGADKAKKCYQEMLCQKVPSHDLVLDYVSFLTGSKKSDSSAISCSNDSKKRNTLNFERAPSRLNDEHTYRYSIRSMLLADQPLAALNTWIDMIQKHNIPATTASLTPLVNFFANLGDTDSMERLIELSRKLGVRESPRYCAVISATRIKAYGLSNRHQESFRIWDEFLAGGGIPSVAMQCLILDACGYAQNVDRLSTIADLLIEKPWGGLHVNIWTSAIEAYCRMHNLPLALDLLENVCSHKKITLTTKLVGTLLTVKPSINQPFLDRRVWLLINEVGGPSKFTAGVVFPSPRSQITRF